MANRNYFIRTLSEEGVASATVDLKAASIADGLQVHYENITVENESSKGSYATPGYIKSGVFYPILATIGLPLGLRVGWHNIDLVLPSQSQLAIRVEASKNADNLRVTLQGFTWELNKRKPR